MVVAIGITLYATFCAFLILPHLEAPPIFTRMAIGLCASEFVAAVGWGFTQTDMFESAAGLQIPALTAIVFVVAGAYGVFSARRW